MIFCNTSNQVGLLQPLLVRHVTKWGCCPPVNLKNKCLMLIWYHGKAMGLLFPYIPKKSTNIPCKTSQRRHNCRFCLNFRFTEKYKPNLNFSPKKFQLSEFHQVSCLYKEGKSIFQVPQVLDTGTSLYWWILEHFWCTSIARKCDIYVL